MKHVKRFLSRIAAGIAPLWWKERHELGYWKKQAMGGKLTNNHYKHFYTTHFGLSDSDYDGKFVLDIGCGPRGSLEWASMASRRIGVDPLVREYLELGARDHAMEYVDAPSEDIPIPDALCDVVCSFNSLDHVDNVERTLGEIKRVTRPGGLFLLIVEVNHRPTATEPHELSPKKIVGLLQPVFDCESLEVFRPGPDGVYAALRANQRLPFPEADSEAGYMSARFRKALLEG
jgi:SAM-dependent methyltransferase